METTDKKFCDSCGRRFTGKTALRVGGSQLVVCGSCKTWGPYGKVKYTRVKLAE